MANPIDAYYDRLVDSVTANRQRMESYKTLYNENHAYRLANAYAQYPWVNPQILVSLVLMDGDEMLPEIADVSANKMFQETGATPYDLARQQNIAQLRQQSILDAAEQEDPDGDGMLELYAQSWESI
jgi:hypothetical protein